jgi:retinol dehydrogenase-12
MYMADCKVKEPSTWVRSDEGKKAQKRVFEELLEILEGIESGVVSALRQHEYQVEGGQ